MSISIRQSIAWSASLLCCAAAQAQSVSTPAAPTATAATRQDPLDAKAAVAPLTYESSFARYRPLSNEKLISWREANDTVARIGGWRVYAREAQQAEPLSPPAPGASAPATPTPTPTPTPKPSAHDGHKTP